MQLLNKLSSLSDTLLPHTDFTVSLPLDACRERLENNLYLRVLPNSYQTRPYKTYETHFEDIGSEALDFTVLFDGERFKITGHLAPYPESSKTYVKAHVSMTNRGRWFWVADISLGLLVILIFLVDELSGINLFSKWLRLGVLYIVFAIWLQWVIGYPLSIRERSKKFLQAVEFTLKSN